MGQTGRCAPATMHRSPSFPTFRADFSGVVSALGEGVKDFAVGDAVFGVCDVGQEAAYAEKVAIKSAIVARKPAGLRTWNARRWR